MLLSVTSQSVYVSRYRVFVLYEVCNILNSMCIVVVNKRGNLVCNDRVYSRIHDRPIISTMVRQVASVMHTYNMIDCTTITDPLLNSLLSIHCLVQSSEGLSSTTNPNHPCVCSPGSPSLVPRPNQS